MISNSHLMTTFWQALHSLFQDIFAKRGCILLPTGSRCSVMCRNMYCTILKSKMTTCLCFSTWNTYYGHEHSRSQPLCPPDPNLFRYCTHLAPRIESTLCFISFVFVSLIWESFFYHEEFLGPLSGSSMACLHDMRFQTKHIVIVILLANF